MYDGGVDGRAFYPLLKTPRTNIKKNQRRSSYPTGRDEKIRKMKNNLNYRFTPEKIRRKRVT